MATVTIDLIDEKTSDWLTGEALAKMAHIGRAELVNGEIIKQMPTGHKHGSIEALLAILIGAYLLQNKIGRVLTGETGLYTRRNPDTVRAMDVAYISNERYARVTSASYLDIAPELIIEVMSPGDSWSGVHEKIDEYFAADALQVWIVDPRREQVHVYSSPTNAAIYGAAETIAGGDILPQFSLSVAAIFA